MAEPVDHRVVDVEVDMHPVAVTAGGIRDGVEGAVGDLDQRIHVRHHDTVALDQGVVCFTQRRVQDGAVVGVEVAAQFPASVVEMPQRQEFVDVVTGEWRDELTDASIAVPGADGPAAAGR